MTALQLRDWQVDALERTATREAEGVRRQLGVAATGLGKTVVFSALAEQRGGRSLVLAHRDELVGQAVHKLTEVWGGLGATTSALELLLAGGHADQARALEVREDGVGVVKGRANDVRASVIVASVQTLARARRLGQLVGAYTDGTSLLNDPVDPFRTVIVDEAHHAAAPSYRGILEGLGAGEPDGPLLLGVTATPDRGDGRGLDDVFDEVVWSYDIRWGIGAGYLADVRGKRIRLEALDLEGVKVSRGDYDEGATGRALIDAAAPAAVARAWATYARDRRTLVFWPTVDASQRCAAEVEAVGGRVAHVDGTTPAEERREVLRRFAAGGLDVVTNCNLLTEGFDDPGVGCVVIARPTKSRGLYTQMVGRGTRRHPDKDHLLVLDVVGATEDHSLVGLPVLFGVKAKARVYEGGESAAAVVADEEAEAVRLGELRAEDVQLFEQVRAEGIAWLALHRPGDDLRRYIRPLGTRGGQVQPTVVLAQRRPGQDVWTAGLQFATGEKRVLMANVSMELAQGVAEDYVRRNGGALVLADAAWRTRRPSKRQRELAGRWHLKVDKGWNAGQLSDALDAHIARIKARKPKPKAAAR